MARQSKTTTSKTSHRGRNEGSLQSTAQGKWRAWVTLPNGARKSKTFATKPEARFLIIAVDTQAGATQLLTGHKFSDKDPPISTLLSAQYAFADVLIRLEDSEFLEDDDKLNTSLMNEAGFVAK